MDILPPQQKDGEIKFFLAKGLPYRRRMVFVALCLFFGLGLQLTAGFWIGYPLLLLGLLLGVNSGYDAAPRVIGAETWERVTPDEYEKIKLKAGQLKAWDDDLFDWTSGWGLFGLAATGGGCALGYFMLASAWGFPDGYWVYFALDVIPVFLPLWFMGTREYLKKDRLIIKIEMFQRVLAALSSPSDVQVQPMLALCATEAGGKTPEDARLMIKLLGAPKDFYGLQAQLSINSVQGRDFPYLYCVLIAKKGSGLFKGWEEFRVEPDTSLLSGLLGFLLNRGAGKLTYEPDAPGDVEIIVIRQATTRTSGYFTPPEAALAVVDASLKMARGLLAVNAKKTAAA